MAENKTVSDLHRETATHSSASDRFTSQSATAEDVLKESSVGLVNLSDYRKRRAEAIEQTGHSSAASTPRSGTPTGKKKQKKTKTKLSFEDDEEDFASVGATPIISKSNTPAPDDLAGDSDAGPVKRFGPNSAVRFAPKAMTKAAMLKDAQTREQLRKEFLAMQEAVKATEIVIPYVFYDGTNVPGGRVRVKKGDHIWLFLEKARKVGAEMGVGDSGRKGWARISVDDLMLVRGDIIIPPHFDFYYFMVNKTLGYQGWIFEFSAEPTEATPNLEDDAPEDEKDYDPLAPKKKKERTSNLPDQSLEGFDQDASLTKVVDRRWYEKNKHIFPASLWEEFDSTKDYSNTVRKDAAGNVLYFDS